MGLLQGKNGSFGNRIRIHAGDSTAYSYLTANSQLLHAQLVVGVSSDTLDRTPVSAIRRPAPDRTHRQYHQEVRARKNPLSVPWEGLVGSPWPTEPLNSTN